MDENTSRTTAWPPQFRRFLWSVIGLTVVFALPLWRLVDFAWSDDLYSYIVLVPVLVAYLTWSQKSSLPAASAPAKGPAWLFLLGGLVMLLWHWLAPAKLVAENLAPTILAYVLWLVGAGCWVLGGRLMRALIFPFSLLIFLVPLPECARDALETGLQHGSAVVAGWMFAVSDVPVYHVGLSFQLPGITLMVAPECSGIHSTVVLFITSLVAGRLFLNSPWRRLSLCLVVIPLALLRNGFRIFVLGELCVHIGPQMIDSPIHHRGGPIFFALSLIPFFALLYWMRRLEHPRKTASPTV